MKRLSHWRRVIARLAHARVLELLRIVDQPSLQFPEGHGWNGPDECDGCGYSLAYVAEGWDRWKECTNSLCIYFAEDDSWAYETVSS